MRSVTIKVILGSAAVAFLAYASAGLIDQRNLIQEQADAAHKANLRAAAVAASEQQDDPEPLSLPRVVLFVGDSYPAGTGATGPQFHYPATIGKQLNWHINLDAQGGTGFIADGHINSPEFSPLKSRLEYDSEKYTAEMIVIDAGRNDRYYAPGQLRAAIGSYITRARAEYPDARIVIVAPTFLTAVPGGNLAEVTRALRAVAKVKDATFVDLNPGHSTLFDKPRPDLVSGDKIHPNNAGHEAYTEKFVKAFNDAGLTR